MEKPFCYEYHHSVMAKAIANMMVKVEAAGYAAVAMVSDVGSTNFRVWKPFEIDPL